jgi:4-amino-4-deoxychorismate lyase
MHGTVQHVEVHQKRFARSYFAHYGQAPHFDLLDGLQLPEDLDPSKKYKLKIRYGATNCNFEVTLYENKLPKTLQLVTADHLDYGSKWTDRKALENLFAQRQKADDVLIIKNNLLTDSSYANILLTDGLQIVTPAKPLLEGCCRARLVAHGLVSLSDVTVQALTNYGHFQLINAMNDFDAHRWLPISQIMD